MAKKLIKPSSVFWDTEDLNYKLFFDDSESIAPTGKYLIRGGVCFPMITDEGLNGHAVLCGRSLDNGKIYVFEESKFIVVDHIWNGNKVEYEGIIPWLLDMWRTYYGDTFFYQQNFEVVKKYRLQMIKNMMLEPKPRFIECKRKDNDQSMHTLFEKDMTGNLIYSRSSKIYSEMQQFEADIEQKYPALHALTCALNGYERYIN